MVELETRVRAGDWCACSRAYVSPDFLVGDAERLIAWARNPQGRFHLEAGADTSIAVADGNAFVIARDADTPRVVLAAFDATTGERALSPLSLQVSSTAGSAATAGGGS